MHARTQVPCCPSQGQTFNRLILKPKLSPEPTCERSGTCPCLLVKVICWFMESGTPFILEVT